MAKTLTVKQSRAVQSLLAGATVKDAALAGNVSRTTLYKWLGRPEFKTELQRADGEIVEVLTRRLTALGKLALDNLEEVLSDPDTPQGIKVRAAVEEVEEDVFKCASAVCGSVWGAHVTGGGDGCRPQGVKKRWGERFVG